MPRRKRSDASSNNSTLTPEALGRELSTAIVLFHEAVASRLGLGAAEWRCWGLLDGHGPMTAGNLADLSRFTTGAITGIVDRLEKSGYAKRERNPHDRRSVMVHPLRIAELKQQIAPIFESLGRSMTALANRYTPEQQVAIHDYFVRTIQILHDETAKVTKKL